MAQFTHHHVISGGIALITLSLVALFLFEDKEPNSPASLSEAISTPATQSTPEPQSSVLLVQASPTADLISMVTTALSPILSPLSPIVSPMSPSVSPSNTPAIKPNPTPSVTIAATPPIPAPQTVVINEVGWMGTDSGASDEWIELFNSGNTAINLSGWVLKSETDDSPHIALEKTIGPGSYYLIERTDDTVISDIAADLVASFGRGGLNNTGERLILLNPQGQVIDQAGEGSGWPAGTNSPKASMERISHSITGANGSNWAHNDGGIIQGKDQDSGAINGTPKAKNSKSF